MAIDFNHVASLVNRGLIYGFKTAGDPKYVNRLFIGKSGRVGYKPKGNKRNGYILEQRHLESATELCFYVSTCNDDALKNNMKLIYDCIEARNFDLAILYRFMTEFPDTYYNWLSNSLRRSPIGYMDTTFGTKSQYTGSVSHLNYLLANYAKNSTEYDDLMECIRGYILDSLDSKSTAQDSMIIDDKITVARSKKKVGNETLLDFYLLLSTANSAPMYIFISQTHLMRVKN